MKFTRRCVGGGEGVEKVGSLLRPKFRSFLPLPPQFSFFLPSLRGPLVEFSKRRGLKCACFGLSCETWAASDFALSFVCVRLWGLHPLRPPTLRTHPKRPRPPRETPPSPLPFPRDPGLPRETPSLRETPSPAPGQKKRTGTKKTETGKNKRIRGGTKLEKKKKKHSGQKKHKRDKKNIGVCCCGCVGGVLLCVFGLRPSEGPPSAKPPKMSLSFSLSRPHFILLILVVFLNVGVLKCGLWALGLSCKPRQRDPSLWGLFWVRGPPFRSPEFGDPPFRAPPVEPLINVFVPFVTFHLVLFFLSRVSIFICPECCFFLVLGAFVSFVPTAVCSFCPGSIFLPFFFLSQHRGSMSGNPKGSQSSGHPPGQRTTFVRR